MLCFSVDSTLFPLTPKFKYLDVPEKTNSVDEQNILSSFIENIAENIDQEQKTTQTCIHTRYTKRLQPLFFRA